MLALSHMNNIACSDLSSVHENKRTGKCQDWHKLQNNCPPGIVPGALADVHYNWYMTTLHATTGNIDLQIKL